MLRMQNTRLHTHKQQGLKSGTNVSHTNLLFLEPEKAEAPENGGCGGENVGKRQET